MERKVAAFKILEKGFFAHLFETRTFVRNQVLDYFTKPEIL
jgi:hypothetical protein